MEPMNNTDEQYFLNTLPNCDKPNEQFIIETTFKGSIIEIHILMSVLPHKDDGDPSSPITITNDGYAGQITNDTLQETADGLEIPFSDFLAETRLALTQSEKCNFLYQFDGCKFCWRKVLTSGLKIIYGSIQMTQKPAVKDDLLWKAIQLNVQNQEQISNIVGEHQRFQKDHKDFMKNYDEFVEQKSNLETTLLMKFTLLLNSKKRKIAELEEKLKNVTNEQRTQISSCDNCTNCNGESSFYDENESDEEYQPSQQLENKRIKAISTQQLKRSDSLDSSQSEEFLPLKTVPKRMHHTGFNGQKEGESSKSILANEVTLSKSDKIIENNVEQIESDPQDVFNCDTQELFGDM